MAGSIGSVLLASFFLPLRSYIRYIVSISIGVLIGLVFFDLIPEALEESAEMGMYALIGGFLFFILLSRVFKHYHHHHENEECEHSHSSDTSFIVFGDALHNTVDGIIIVTAFSVSVEVGIAATIGILLHELPQEVAEYAVLRGAGFSKIKAILYNIVSASTVLLGVMIGYFFLEFSHSLSGILLGVASGNLLYVIMSDIVPRVLDRNKPKKKLFSELLLILFGVVLMATIVHFAHREHVELEPTEHIGQVLHY